MSRSRRLARERVLIVGAGRAGVSAAEELRRSGFPGEVVVFGDEPGLPYYRPACSKGILTGSKRPSDLLLDLNGCGDVRWYLGRRVVSANPAERTIETDDGRVHGYDGLVIATGSQPRPLPQRRAGLHRLQRIEDAWAFRHALRNANRVAVIGGGVTGCEAAWAVRSLARECVLIDSGRYVMARAVGRHAGRAITEQLWREGVELYLNRRVEGIDRGRTGRWWLTLDDDTEVDADIVAYATGGRPDTSWLAGGPNLDVSDGVLCDASLRVVGAEAVVAAGDVARWPNLRLGTEPRRSELWTTAVQHGRAAAQALLAGDEPTPPVTALQQMWSDQFGLRIQVAGDIGQPGTSVQVTRLSPGRQQVARSGVLVNYLIGDRLAGVVAINAPRLYTALVRAMLVARPVLEPPALPEPQSLPEVVGMAELGDVMSSMEPRRPTHVVSSGLPARRTTERRKVVQRSEQRSAPVPVAAVVRPPRDGSSVRSVGYLPQPAERVSEPAPYPADTPDEQEVSGIRPTISVNRRAPGEEPSSWAYS